MPELSHTEFIVRLLVISALAGIIGLEREYYRRPAGLRTNIMVGIGSMLMTVASVHAATLQTAGTADPARIAAQLVAGIGFIGAGAIIRPTGGSRVVGLTTAATLWVVCGIGIAVGLGYYVEAALTTAMVMFTFFAMHPIVTWTRRLRASHKSNVTEDFDEQT
jgi:putative Mg2+ transporter-C (MgtC) family protein